MERHIDALIKDLESGKINRREFCEAVAIAAAMFAASGPANAAAPRGFKVIGINHLTYDCADYRKARDFYTSVFGMQTLKDDGRTHANLGFGPAQGQGGSFLTVRNAPANAPKPGATIDHVCYTIPNWDEGKVVAALNARNLPQTGRPGSWHVYDPFDFDVQIGNSVEENAFRRG